MMALRYFAAWFIAAFAGLDASATEPAPVSLPRTAQFDVNSKAGEAYRISVALPLQYDREKAYPVLYVLEGNVYFAAAVDALTRQARFRVAAPAIVVGIGYPTDDYEVGLVRRWYDLSPTVDPKDKRRTGGGDEHLSFIEEVVKPLIAGRHKVDASQQALWGHSLGGLMVLRAMFRNPNGYSAYLASSPSVWWDSQMVLKDEDTFVQGLATRTTPIKLLVSYGSRDGERIMKDGAELAERLGKVSADRLKVERHVFDGENHISVAHPAVMRSLRFAFPPPPR